jgi:hypothetical protein
MPAMFLGYLLLRFSQVSLQRQPSSTLVPNPKERLCSPVYIVGIAFAGLGSGGDLSLGVGGPVTDFLWPYLSPA